MLFELVDTAAILCPVAGIMHTWGDFVHDQTLPCHEEFNTHDAHIIQRVQCLGRQQRCIRTLARCQLRGHRRGPQNAIRMQVFARVIGRNLSTQSTRSNDADFALEINKAFQNSRGTVQRIESCRKIRIRPDPHLALAVIAKAARFQNRLRADFAQSSVQVIQRIDLGIRRSCKAQIVQKFLLDQTVLTGCQSLPPGSDRTDGFQDIQCLGGDVFELVSDDIDRAGKCLQSIGVIIACGCDRMCHLCCRAICARFKDMTLVPQSCGRH